ncbi:DNA primase DnaG [Aeropyrum pernix]|uniref:DNA primase DnaG n=1 Tax=Aeropyrum pernix TaxID=56636 RepID=A0A401HAD1_AERPX|nr:DNA primase DnaG [Aeropyrum pernix]GBF09425.1 DNA primase DnaG [Aeropyrum pernix]
MKYLIRARLEVDGRVEKHDVIGAIFGQTESLLGSDFSLEELQNKDKLGRIHVELKYQGTKTIGTISVPSNLSRVETAIIAAMLETIDKIGPYPAKITIEEIRDLRLERLEKIKQRARELLKLMKEKEPDIREIIREVLQEEQAKAQVAKLVEYGPERLPAGPGVEKADTIIVVEGRSDVNTLLRYGYTNVIALGGAREKVPETIKRLAEQKKVILFVDGDRGGELILKNVLPQMKVDYVARAPEGREVESLTGREIAQALSQMKPAEIVARELGIEAAEKPAEEAVEREEEAAAEAKPPAPAVQEKAAKPPEEKPPTVKFTIPKAVLEAAKELRGTLEAIVYDKEWRELDRLKVRELYDYISKSEPGRIYAVVFDGIITQRLLDIASEKGVGIIIGNRIGNKITHKPTNVKFLTFSDLF